jgi:hypothetical protein
MMGIGIREIARRIGRWYFYERQERSLLKVLPSEPFAPKKIATLTVQRNYHVQLREDFLYYSVPYLFVGKKVKTLYDNRVVEVYYDNSRIALHIRKPHSKAYTTLAEHMPPQSPADAADKRLE